MAIKFVITEGATAPFDKAVSEEMLKAVKHFEHELLGIRTGRAHPSMIDGIKVECYGGASEMVLKNIASISTPDPRTLMVQPWDQGLLHDISRALRESELGVNPQEDGGVLRIVLPEMSRTRRDELIKILQKKLEDSRVSIRNIRKDFHNLIRDTEKAKGVSEDFAKRLSDLLQKITDKFIKQVDDLGAKKETDLKS